MSFHEFYEWMVFDSFEPIGAHRGDIQNGTVAAAIYNVNRTKQEQPVLNWSDVLPRWAGPEVKPDPEALRQKMEIVQAFQNAYDQALQDGS